MFTGAPSKDYGNFFPFHGDTPLLFFAVAEE